MGEKGQKWAGLTYADNHVCEILLDTSAISARVKLSM